MPLLQQQINRFKTACFAVPETVIRFSGFWDGSNNDSLQTFPGVEGNKYFATHWIAGSDGFLNIDSKENKHSNDIEK